MRWPILVAVLAAGCAARPTVHGASSPAHDLAALADRTALFLGEESARELGLTEAAFADTPPLGLEDLRRFEANLKVRADELGRCLPARAALARSEALAYHPASAVVAADGGLEDVRIAGDPGPAALACVREALGAWVLPAPARPGRVWFRVTGLGPARPAKPPPPGPVERPRMRDPGCVMRSVRPPRNASGPWTKVPTVVRFAVLPDGAVGHFHVLEPFTLPTDVGREVERAVKACGWIAGSVGGAPTPVWVVLPLRWSR